MDTDTIIATAAAVLATLSFIMVIAAEYIRRKQDGL